MTDFGKAIRILRIGKNRKQKQDAEDFGATASYISAIENGKKKITDSYLEYCIKTYGNKDSLIELAEKHNKSIEKIAVIRCKDCKHYADDQCDRYADETLGYVHSTQADGYCWVAERKEE